MGIIFTNKSVAEAIRKTRIFNQHEVVVLPLQPNVDARLSDHTDLSVFLGALIYVDKTLYNAVRLQLNEIYGSLWTDEKLICGSSQLGNSYPEDIPYNAVRLKHHFFHRIASTEPKIVQAINCEKIDVKQGYTRCSSLIVGDSAVITEDENLARIYSEKGYSVLKIDPGFVELPGYNHGFFGGTGGLIGDTIVLNGSLGYHPNEAQIRSFINKQNFKLLELHQSRLVDCGSILYYQT